jgi:hypothetical protein
MGSVRHTPAVFSVVSILLMLHDNSQLRENDNAAAAAATAAAATVFRWWGGQWAHHQLDVGPRTFVTGHVGAS